MPPSSLANHLGSFMLDGHTSFFPGWSSGVVHAPWACLLLPWLVIWGRSCSMCMPPSSLANHLGSFMLDGHASFFPGWSSGVVHAPWACLLLPWLIIWGRSCSMGIPPSFLAGHLGSLMLHGHASFFPVWSSGVVHAPWACLLLPWLVIWGRSCSMGMPPSSLANHLGSLMLHGHASFFPG